MRGGCVGRIHRDNDTMSKGGRAEGWVKGKEGSDEGVGRGGRRCLSESE
jgi:hypothetical protein